MIRDEIKQNRQQRREYVSRVARKKIDNQTLARHMDQFKSVNNEVVPVVGGGGFPSVAITPLSSGFASPMSSGIGRH